MTRNIPPKAGTPDQVRRYMETVKAMAEAVCRLVSPRSSNLH